MLDEIIENVLERITTDVMALDYVGDISFVNFFPKDEEHRMQLEDEARERAVCVDVSVRGNFYRFTEPVVTKFGELSIFKIRYVDDVKTMYGAGPDFVVTDWDRFVEKYKDDKRFSYFKNDSHPPCQGYIFQNERSHFCFVNPPVTEWYGG